MKHLLCAAVLAMGMSAASAETPQMQMSEDLVVKNVSLGVGSANGLVTPLLLIALIAVALKD